MDYGAHDNPLGAVRVFLLPTEALMYEDMQI